jgi:hypothetical protein
MALAAEPVVEAEAVTLTRVLRGFSIHQVVAEQAPLTKAEMHQVLLQVLVELQAAVLVELVLQPFQPSAAVMVPQAHPSRQR